MKENDVIVKKRDSEKSLNHHIERMPSLNTITEFIEEHSEHLSRVDDINFNTLQFCRDIERSKATSALTFHILQKLNPQLLL